MTCSRETVLPSTIPTWEAVLVEQFLRIGADGDASPLRSFEITAETLASALRIEAVTPDEAIAALQSAALADVNLWSALSTGRRRAPTATSPNCFTYLAITLLIDTLLEGHYSEQGQFRDRLRSWLGTTRSMMQLSGVATMWRELAAWLDARVAAGERFRRLVLPDPPRTWTQIGYTRCLSFPTRADVGFLKRVMARFRHGESDPPRLIRAIDSAIHCGDASWGMESAFHEFRDAFRRGTASTDHRFWRLVLRSAKTTDFDERDDAVLELSFDQDQCRSILLGSVSDTAALNVMPDIGAAMRSDLVRTSANLSAAAMRGVAFFRQVGMARWHAQSDPPLGSAVTHVAFAASFAHLVEGINPSLVKSGDWWLTSEPIAERAVDDLLSALQLNRRRGEHLLDIGVADGVRVGSAWLGRRAFLPRVDAGSRRTVVARVAGQEDGAPITVSDGRLASRETVIGNYDVSVTSGIDGEMLEWSRRVVFVANARPHDALGGADQAAPLVREWLTFEGARPRKTHLGNLAWSNEDFASADVLEAIYASGRSGMSESEVVDLVGRGAAAQVNIWSLLRSLQESGFIEARHRQRWRGRVWTLGKPKLITMDGSARGLVVMEGATCAALEREFCEVADGVGGTPFRRLGVSEWSPAVIGAIGVDVQALATRLGWQLERNPVQPRLRPGGLETSVLVAEHHKLASSWDWNRRLFVTDAVDRCEVSLTRWVHPGGRDHDVYRVTSAKHNSSHMTRNAAILTAHIVARVPLFKVDGEKLMRTSREGALPHEFARWLRLMTLVGGGAINEHGYGYYLGEIEPTAIAQALPGCIEGMRSNSRSKFDILLEARRSGGRTRVRWVNGALAVTS
jgi:hypothetical protein